jgi:hypothetical protein
MRAHVISCEQRGLFIPNQNQVLFGINEHLEFLAGHVLMDPCPGNPSMLPSAGVARFRRQAERLEAPDARRRLESSIAAETASLAQSIAVNLAPGLRRGRETGREWQTRVW